MKRMVLVGMALALGAGAALAQADAIKARQQHMKEMLTAARPTYGMLRGSVPYNQEQVQNALRVYAANAAKFEALFPDSGAANAETAALPAIWQNKPAFNALFTKMEADAKAAQASIKDEASFKAEYPKVIDTCNTCHKSYQRPS